MRHTSNQSKKFLFQKRLRRWVVTGISVIAACLVIFLLSLFSSWKALAITTVQVSGVDPDRITEIHTAMMATLQGKYIGIFSRSNTLIYPRSTMESLIRNAYKEVSTVSIHRAGMHGLAVTIQEKDPAAVMCASFPDFSNGDLSDNSDACYFADANGFIFKKAPSFSGDVYNRYYIPDLAQGSVASSSDLMIGRYATSSQEFARVQKIYDAVKAGGIAAAAILFKPNGEYELYAHNPLIAAETSENPGIVVIYFNTMSSPDTQISNLLSFWDHMVQDAHSKDEPIRFEYIDARYGENVFYKEVK